MLSLAALAGSLLLVSALLGTSLASAAVPGPSPTPPPTPDLSPEPPSPTPPPIPNNPPSILFAGEALSATSYDHVILLFSKHLDQTVAISPADFAVTIDGIAYTPATASYLFAGLSGLLDPSGSTFIRLNLPAGVTVGTTADFQVAYTPGSAPLRDLSLRTAAAETVAGQILDSGPFAFIAAIVDAANAANRVTMVLSGQFDLGSMPATGDFLVTVDGTPAPIVAVEPRMTDLGLGFADLVLASPVPYAAIVTVSYAPGGSPFTARNGGAVLDPIPTIEALNLVLPTSASAIIEAGGSVATSAASVVTPVAAAVTSPNGGLVTIDVSPAGASPTGYTFFGQQVVITAPPASSVDAPLLLVFEIHATLVPTGETATSVVVLRNGAAVGDCTGPGGSAVPSPCIVQREDVGGGNIRIKIWTMAASLWNFAVVKPYAFGGFLAPLKNNQAVNLATAGSAVPIAFSLGGYRGPAIFTAGSPASQPVACNTLSPLGPVVPADAPGAAGLTYAAGSDAYRYLWKTERAWAGTCRVLILSFGDGTRQSAVFRFK